MLLILFPTTKIEAPQWQEFLSIQFTAVPPGLGQPSRYEHLLSICYQYVRSLEQIWGRSGSAARAASHAGSCF